MDMLFLPLIYLALFGLVYTPLTTIIRVAAHAGKSFQRFSISNSAFTRFAKVTADITTVIAMPLAYLVLVGSGGPGMTPWLQSGQAWFFLPVIAVSSIGYFFAVYTKRPLRPALEIVLGVLAGSLIGNFPLIFLYALTFTRRQALLNEASPEVLDQRRYDRTEILDYLPTGEEPAYVYDYSGSAGNFLRQPLFVKIGVYLGGGAAAIALGALLAGLLGVEVTAPF